MRLVHFIFALCLLTASFDVFLVIHIGANLHFAQALSLLVSLAGMARVAQQGRVVWPRGATSLLLWVFVQTVLVPESGNLSIGLQFWVLLLLMVTVWFAVVELYGEGDRLRSLMRIYMGSYVFVAAFGLVQFLTPLMGLPGLLVRQWIIHGRLARINGFNSEPSFFVTYLMLGWIMLVELRVSNAEIARGRLWKVATVLLTVTLILATSKLGWAIMIVEVVARSVPWIWRFVRNLISQAGRGSMKIALPRAKAVLMGVLAVMMLTGGARYLFARINPVTFLNGTGLGGTAAHSTITRTAQAMATLVVFEEHPLVGRSLGGVPVYIANDEGVRVNGMEEARLYWGFPVLLDLLAASGVIGIIPFLLFLSVHTVGAMRTATRHWPDERAKWLRALGRAMIFEWLMLMADQNVLRTYVWFHFAMIAVVAYHLEHTPAAGFRMANAAPPPVIPQRTASGELVVPA